MIISNLIWLCLMSISPELIYNTSGEKELDNPHIFYYSTIEFVETPLSAIKGSIPLSKTEAMKRNHYRFAYNDQQQLMSVSFFNGPISREPNHTANLFTLAHRMEFEYGDKTETISFFDTDDAPINVLGDCRQFVYTHNELGFRNSLYFLDRNGQRITNGWGIFEYQWEYMDDGSVIEERYDDANNQVSIRPGFEFFTVRLYFNPLGHIALMQNIDADGNLVENSSGAAQDRIKTNAKGNFIEWNVLNKHHKLEKGNGPNVAVGKQTFDKYGNETSLLHYDENSQIIASAYGIANSNTTYDEFGNMLERTFYDEEGLPTRHGNAGYHKLVIAWDELGNRRTSLRYFDVENKPFLHATRGYHEVRYSYDKQDRLKQISYHSTKGDLVNRKDNNRAYSIYEYDRDGTHQRVNHFDKSNVKQEP